MNISEFLGEPEEWEAEAVCAQTDPEVFFPGKGGSTREAKRLCGTCPVTDECLARALSFGEVAGIWGATTERERREMLRAGRRAVA